MRIETERLHIRRFGPGDGDDLFGIIGDAAVVRYEPYRPFTREECEREAFLRSNSEDYWAVCQKENGRVVGSLSLQKREYGSWEVGFVFGAAYQGQGYAAEATRAMLHRAFTVWQAHRVTAACFSENEASRALLEKLGMRCEGRQVKSVYNTLDDERAPQWKDVCLYALLREEWAAGPGNAQGV